MNLFAESVFEYLKKQVLMALESEAQVGKLLLMMPSLPAPAVIAICERLENYCLKSKETLSSRIKISADLANRWERATQLVDRNAFEKAKSREWLDNDGSLTQHRNAPALTGGKMTIVLLIGINEVTDSASLGDFHYCGAETIWNEQMNQRFASWIMKRLIGNSIAFEQETVDHFDSILQQLVSFGLADIIDVSRFLDNLDLGEAQDGADAEKVLLRSLGEFNLPIMSGYRFQKGRVFGEYVDDALKFFNYEMFMEKRVREQAAKKVDGFILKFKDEISANEAIAADLRGLFLSDKEFLNAIQVYILKGDPILRDKLFSCDFVTLRDRILLFKSSKKSPGPAKLKKIDGGPVEVVLEALWLCLMDFQKEMSIQKMYMPEVLARIRITGLEFKHDFDGGKDERKEYAKKYLARLIGGVDDWLEKHIDFDGFCVDRHIPIESKLQNKDLDYTPARTSEPHLRFQVEVFGVDAENSVKREFVWRLPDIQPYRLSESILNWAYSLMKETLVPLPVFHILYYEEIMLSKDDEELRRVLLHSIEDESGHYIDMLQPTDYFPQDVLLPEMKTLAAEYQEFIRIAAKKGLHFALRDECWTNLRKAYEKACQSFIGEPGQGTSSLGTLLMRAFLIVKERPISQGSHWIWHAAEPSGIVTILHPVLLEMLEAHVQYLIASFNAAAAKAICAPTVQAFRENVWRNYVELASIQMPIAGLLKDDNKILDTNVNGEGLFHRIGDVKGSEATLTTRMLTRYEAFEDEDIVDAEIFRDSRESRLLYRIMKDYRQLHPHSADGLSIAVYRNSDVQCVIAAVDAYLREISIQYHYDAELYLMNVTIFSESGDDTSVARWLEQWRERWEAAETEDKLAHYRNAHLSLSHRIVSSKDNYLQFSRIIREGLELDIVFLQDFIGAGALGNEFRPVSSYDVTNRTLKFPILEKAFCAVQGPATYMKRARILSNRQFRLGSYHAEVLARLKNSNIPGVQEHVIMGFGDFTPWQRVVDELHKRAEWVVCIDPNIDERLVSLHAGETTKTREIIGFGSGVGTHGESNYTVSTEQFSLSDISHRLKAAIGEIYLGWAQNEYTRVADKMAYEAGKLSGLSLVRATGVGEYIRDYMAYALVRRLLSVDSNALCNQLISLDAYRHWFDGAESDLRPDLLWMVARISPEGRIQLELSVIECKLALRAENHLEKARAQIESGLRHLMPLMMPFNRTGTIMDDDRPDQRFWWLQLHRLIGSKAEIAATEQNLILSALERLTDGDYDISWGAAAITFWTDADSWGTRGIGEWRFPIDGKELIIGVHSFGSDFVKSICSDAVTEIISLHGTRLHFSSRLVDAEPKPEEKQLDEEFSGKESVAIPPTNAFSNPPSINDEKETAQVNLSSRPERVFLGVSTQGERRIYWEFGHNDLTNRHMVIFGTSGMGKTYTIQCLLAELAKFGHNSLIVDYTNGFMENQLELDFVKYVHPMQHEVRYDPIPVNPFRRLDAYRGSVAVPEPFVTTAQRITGVFSEVYQLGDQQKSVLYSCIKKGLEDEAKEPMSLDRLLAILQQEGKTTATVVSKIVPFVDMKPFNQGDQTGWEEWFCDEIHRCHVLQLAGYMRESWRLIAEFAMIDLYAYYRIKGSKDKPRVVVLDEFQNLDQKEDSPLSQLLREGRKFGFSLILATQIMSNLKKDEKDRLFNAGHKLFFRPADTEMRSYAEIASMTAKEEVDVWMKKLSELQKGECYSLGQSLNESSGKLETKAFKIRIAALKDRE